MNVDLQLSDCHGTFEQKPGAGVKPLVAVFRSIDGSVKIPDINSPIENSLKVVAQVDNQPVDGILSVKGTVAAIKANKVDASSASANESIDLSNLDIGARPPCCRPPCVNCRECSAET